MTPSYQLVFRGEILPGFDAQVVRSHLATALKIPPERVETLFGGHPVILRKDLPEAEVARYVAHLAGLGVRVHAQPQPTADAASALATPKAAPAPASIPAEAARAEPQDMMVCPSCGERQPKRTLCRSCAVDMKRFAEAQELAQREEREARLAEKRGDTASEPSVVAALAREEAAARLFGTSFDGRVGRLDYLFGGLLSSAVLMFGIAALLRGTNFLFLLFAVMLCFFFGLRLAVLRCHDRGWSGWLWPLLLVPYVGWLFGLLLTVLPGERDDNRYGAPKRPLPVPGMVGTAVLFGFALMMLVRSPDGIDSLQYMMNGAQMAKAGEDIGRPSAEGAAVAAQVEIFTTTTCSECARAKAYMKRRGVQYVERDVESDVQARKEFYERGGRGVPYIFVRGQSMHGFDEDAFERLLAY